MEWKFMSVDQPVELIVRIFSFLDSSRKNRTKTEQFYGYSDLCNQLTKNIFVSYTENFNCFLKILTFYTFILHLKLQFV